MPEFFGLTTNGKIALCNRLVIRALCVAVEGGRRLTIEEVMNGEDLDDSLPNTFVPQALESARRLEFYSMEHYLESTQPWNADAEKIVNIGKFLPEEASWNHPEYGPLCHVAAMLQDIAKGILEHDSKRSSFVGAFTQHQVMRGLQVGELIRMREEDLARTPRHALTKPHFLSRPQTNPGSKVSARHFGELWF